MQIIYFLLQKKPSWRQLIQYKTFKVSLSFLIFDQRLKTVWFYRVIGWEYVPFISNDKIIKTGSMHTNWGMLYIRHTTYNINWNKTINNLYFSLMIIIINGIILTVTMNDDNKSRFDLKHFVSFDYNPLIKVFN